VRCELRFMLAQGRVSGAVFTEFLRQLMHHAPQPMFPVLDRRPIHRSRPLRDLVASREGKLRVLFLPPRGPEIDPGEQVLELRDAPWSRQSRPAGRFQSPPVRLDAHQLAPASAMDDPHLLPDARQGAVPALVASVSEP